MWTANRAPARPQRTGSIHSIASVYSNSSRPSSVASNRHQFSRFDTRNGYGYDSDQSSDTPVEDMPAMWQSRRQESGSAVGRLSQKFANGSDPMVTPLRTAMPTRTDQYDDTSSRASTLNGDEDYDFPEKTPTGLRKLSRPPAKDRQIPYYTLQEPTPLSPLIIKERPIAVKAVNQPKGDRQIPYYTLQEPVPLSPLVIKERPTAPVKARVAGPLEAQLAVLMAKVVQIESGNPLASVTPDDYAEMKSRLETLEKEKKAWTKRHENIWTLRDEDVENNIKIRGLLAKARRDLEGMTKLRDDDLANLLVVRGKLAEATAKLDRLQAQGGNGRISPSSSRGARPPSMFMERRDTTDLFAAAKAAALQQRALELEKRNSDLVSQIEALKSGVSTSSMDSMNRTTAHEAWKDHVAALEAKLKVKDLEVAQLRASSAVSAPAVSSGAVEWHRVEAIHEEHANYRERMGGKLQMLRSEKQGLQEELHRKEDECHALEVKVQMLQRKCV